MRRILCIVFVTAMLATSLQPDAVQAEPQFEQQTIDDKVAIGYGTAIGDVDGDGKPDIALADKKQFVWYRNPSWEKFVLAENLTEHDNVCLAVRDIDGDGKAEIAVGAQWNPADTVNSGAVFYLIAPDDRTKKWTPVQLHHEPVVHRMRWVRLDKSRYTLVVSPLHGRGNKNGQGAGVKLLAYEVPPDPRQPWKTEVLEDTLHLTHNLDPAQWIPDTPAEEILYVGREGAMLLSYQHGKWSQARFTRIAGGGEIRMGLHDRQRPFVVTIEPLHGNKLVYYPSAYDRRDGPAKPTDIAGRVLLDNDLKQGHAIATADLFGDEGQEVVAGWREPNSQGKVGVKLYYPVSDKAVQWNSIWIDENDMATEDIRIGDLNADNRPDIVAAGRATHNLKIYWNRSAD